MSPCASSMVAPDAAVNRWRLRFPCDNDASADIVISRPRLALMMLCNAIVRMDSSCTPELCVVLPGADSGNVNGSGRSMRLFETATSASAMRRDQSGLSPVEI